MKTKLLASILGLAALALGSGCTSMINVPPSPAETWGPEVSVLGPVTAKHGRWPLSLRTPPPDETYYVALRSAASGQYGVPENEVALRNITVQIGAELDGTIRDWTATAEAARIKGGATQKSPAAALTELKRLLDAGVITQADYDAKKKSILEKM